MSAPMVTTFDLPGPAAELLNQARELVPVLAQRSAQTTSDRRIPNETIEEFRRAGFFRVLQPKRFGGLELDFLPFALLIRELAHGCGSSAWVYAVMGELGWVIALFPEQAQREVWSGNPDALGCAAIYPAGGASKTRDGYRVSGQWAFVSGSDHAQWVVLTAPCVDGPDTGRIRNFLVRCSDLQVIDDWNVLGLVGTGSKSVKADKVFVPEHRSVAFDDVLEGTAPGRTIYPDNPLYRAPRRYFTAFSISPVLFGLADRALDLVVDSMKKRLASGGAPADLDVMQLKVAESAAEIEMVNLTFEHHLRHNVARAASGVPISEQEVMKTRLVAAYLVRLAREAIERLCFATGSSWIYDRNALQTVFRDAVTGATHGAMSWEPSAKAYSRSIGIDVPR